MICSGMRLSKEDTVQNINVKELSMLGFEETKVEDTYNEGQVAPLAT